tara:strand:- start:124 stop:291 length:168 start_codon:yes stop_codon:yes gene_type:complete
LVEHATENRSVGGSIPSLGTASKNKENKNTDSKIKYSNFLCWIAKLMVVLLFNDH